MSNFAFTSHQTVADAEDELRDHIQAYIWTSVPDDHYDVNALVDIFYEDDGYAFRPLHEVVSVGDFRELSRPHRWS